MTRHADRRPSGELAGRKAGKKMRPEEELYGEEDFPVLDNMLVLRETEAHGGQRQGKRQVRESMPRECTRPVRKEARTRGQGRPERDVPPFRRDERHSAGSGNKRPDSVGRGRESERKGSYGAAPSANRRQAGRGEARPLGGGVRHERQPSVPPGPGWAQLSPLLPEPDAALREGLDRLGAALARVRPLSASHARSLPQDVLTLSRLLTVERAHLHHPYWASPALTSAYLYYFLPWNVLRQARLLTALPLPNPQVWLEQGRRPLLLDMGSGPLSLPIALWLARPQWRALPLTVLALDASSQPLELGRNLLSALAEELGQPAWEVHTVRAPLGQAARRLARMCGERPRSGSGEGSPALWLASAANVINEMLSGGGAGRSGRHEGADFRESEEGVPEAGDYDDSGGMREDSLFGRRLESVLDGLEELLENGDPALPPSLLVVEPGTRLGGTTVMRLRESALERGLVPLAPCTHAADCPLERGRTGRGWCHVTFDCAGAPDWLAQLSQAAGLAKDSLSLAPLLLSSAAETVQDGLDAREAEKANGDGLLSRVALRVLSAPFVVPGLPGRARYACGVGGLALLGDAESLPSGGLVEADIPENPRFDRRSGALLLLPEAEAGEDEAVMRASHPSEKAADRRERGTRGTGSGKRCSQDAADASVRHRPRKGRPYPSARQTPRAPRNERQEQEGRPNHNTGGRSSRRGSR